MEILKAIKDKAPEYNSIYEELINRFTLTQGGRAGTATESKAWEQGKYFSTKYEIFMYAALLGLKNNYKLEQPLNAKKTKFIEIKSWQPSELADYIIMCVFAQSKIDLLELESSALEYIEKEVLVFKKNLEEYANGGFEKIKEKLDSQPEFFLNNDNCFIDLLESNVL